jgi:Fe2+ transport system protein FeoA
MGSPFMGMIPLMNAVNVDVKFMTGPQLVSLDKIPPGTSVIVRKFEGGRELAIRLAALGLSIESHVKVLQNRAHGPLLVLVRDTRIALGRSQSLKILVEELGGE